MAQPLLNDSVWLQKQKYEDAEALYQASLAGTQQQKQGHSVTKVEQKAPTSSLKNEIAQARQEIQNVLKSGSSVGGSGDGTGDGVQKRLDSLEKENSDLKKVVDEMKSLVKKLESRVATLEKSSTTSPSTAAGAAAAPAQVPAPSTPSAAADDDDDDDDDDDMDLFGSDEEADKEAQKLKEERLKAYNEKKAKKPAVIAKSRIVLDCKPYSDETDMVAMEKNVRTIEMDGLVWGASKLAPVGYGIKKLVITCIVEDAKVSVDDLSEQICEEFDDDIQSVDVASFNKL